MAESIEILEQHNSLYQTPSHVAITNEFNNFQNFHQLAFDELTSDSIMESEQPFTLVTSKKRKE